MADSKISALTELTSVDDETDMIAIADITATATKKISVGLVRRSEVRVITASGAQSAAGASHLHITLNHASIINYTITGAPEIGDTLTLFVETAVAHTLVLSGSVTFDGTNQTNTFAVKGDALYMVARTVGLWDIIKNDGTLSA